MTIDPFPLLPVRDAPPLPTDPRGPIENAGMRVTVSDGVQTSGYQFVPQRKPGPWRARWIGGADNPPVALFRREFDLDVIPGQVLAFLSADVSYRLWVNGRLASRGPADIGMDYHRVGTGRWFYDVRDLAPFLRAGRNVFAAEVFAVPLIGWEGTRGRGAFLCEIEGMAETDASWQARAADHWRDAGGFWLYDGANEPVGWRSLGFDDREWQSAVVLEDRWQSLVASEIPPRMEADYPASGLTRVGAGVRRNGGAPFPLTLESGGTFAVRYDRVLSAFVGMTVSGGAGGTLYIEPNEPDEPGFHRRAAVSLSGGTQIMELPFLDSFSVINLRCEGLTTPLVIHDVRANFASLPVAYRGTFSCSDSELTRLWRVCRWATQLCLQTHHLDSPHHQEPISDPGDYMIVSLLNYHAFFEPWLTRQDLRKYAWIMGQCANRVFHTSYALLWLQMLLDYHDYTGDTDLVRELAPTVHSLLETFTGYRGGNGLICEAPNYMFLDWVEIAGFPGHHPPAVIGQGYLTAFYYRALADGIRVAELLREDERVAAYGRLREETKAAFARELWDEGAGLYRDGKPSQSSVPPGEWLPADVNIETHTAHVNVLAVLYDIAPTERHRAILERAITGPDFSCQPYFMHFVFDALSHAGLFERHARPQMARWTIREETQSLLEMWDTGDLSHAWGATPLYQMSARILGVTPASPGYRAIRIAPRPCGLSHAEGTVPTPRGDIRVAWRRDAGCFHLAVEIPDGCVAELVLPDGATTSVGAGHHVMKLG